MKKIFIVSDNKSGTTSLKLWFKDAGLKIGNQPRAEKMWFREQATLGNRPVDWTKYFRTAEVFQDIPFSTPQFLPRLLFNFPDAKFIHISRPATSWYQSLIHHHIRKSLGLEPEFDEALSLKWTPSLRAASEKRKYRGLAPLYQWVCLRYGTTTQDPYARGVLLAAHRFQERQARIVLASRDALFACLDDLSDAKFMEALEEFTGVSGGQITQANLRKALPNTANIKATSRAKGTMPPS